MEYIIYTKGDSWSTHPIALYNAVELDELLYNKIIDNKVNLVDGVWVDNVPIKESYLESLERRIKAIEDKLTKVK